MPFLKVAEIEISILQRSLEVFYGIVPNSKMERNEKTQYLLHHWQDLKNISTASVVFIDLSKVCKRSTVIRPAFTLSKKPVDTRAYTPLPPDHFYFESASEINVFFRADFLSNSCFKYIKTYHHETGEFAEVWQIIPDEGYTLDILKTWDKNKKGLNEIRF